MRQVPLSLFANWDTSKHWRQLGSHPLVIDVGHEEGAVGNRGPARWDRKTRLLCGKHHVLIHDGIPAAANEARFKEVSRLRQEEADGHLTEPVAGRHRPAQRPYDAPPELIVLAGAGDIGRTRESSRPTCWSQRCVR